MRARLAPLALAVVASILSVAGAALAQGAPAGQQGLPPGLSGDADQEHEGTPKPAAPDERAGHVYIRAASSLQLPVGWLSPAGSLEDVISAGFLAGGSLGVGLSRYAELDAAGGYGLFAAGGTCESCTGSLAAANLGFRYHLLQGASLDPWIRLGAGWRSFALDFGDDEGPNVLNLTRGRYHGVDFAQIALGAVFSPVSGFGLGPYFESALGSFVAWPDGSRVGTRPYAFFSFGLSIDLDPVRWASPAPQRAATGDNSHF